MKKVKTFTEKPHAWLAQKFVESGDFYWNSGIFIWHVKAILEAFDKHEPDIAELFNSAGMYYTDKEEEFINKTYAQCKNISIDYAVMEKADNVYVVAGAFGWSDLGSWNALHEIKEKNEHANVIDANAMLYDCKNSLFVGPKDKLIVAQGLDGYLVTEVDNVLLICKKDDEKQFKAYVNDVKKEKGEDFI